MDNYLLSVLEREKDNKKISLYNVIYILRNRYQERLFIKKDFENKIKDKFLFKKVILHDIDIKNDSLKLYIELFNGENFEILLNILRKKQSVVISNTKEKFHFYNDFISQDLLNYYNKVFKLYEISSKYNVYFGGNKLSNCNDTKTFIRNNTFLFSYSFKEDSFKFNEYYKEFLYLNIETLLKRIYIPEYRCNSVLLQELNRDKIKTKKLINEK